jgi:hypothetical protein
VQEINENGVKKWIVEKDGIKNYYDAYDKLPEEVKEMLAMRQTHEFLKQGQAGNSLNIARNSTKIKINQNGKERIYNSMDEVPEEFKKHMGFAFGKVKDFNLVGENKTDVDEFQDIMSDIPKYRTDNGGNNSKSSFTLADNPAIKITDKEKYTSGSLFGTRQIIFIVLGIALLLAAAAYMGLVS